LKEGAVQNLFVCRVHVTYPNFLQSLIHSVKVRAEMSKRLRTLTKLDKIWPTYGLNFRPLAPEARTLINLRLIERIKYSEWFAWQNTIQNRTVLEWYDRHTA